jgi:hypothetical protein
MLVVLRSGLIATASLFITSVILHASWIAERTSLFPIYWALHVFAGLSLMCAWYAALLTYPKVYPGVVAFAALAQGRGVLQLVLLVMIIYVAIFCGFHYRGGAMVGSASVFAAFWALAYFIAAVIFDVCLRKEMDSQLWSRSGGR